MSSDISLFGADFETILNTDASTRFRPTYATEKFSSPRKVRTKSVSMRGNCSFSSADSGGGPCAADYSGTPRRDDHRAATRVHLAWQAGCRQTGFRQAVAALLPQLLCERRDLSY